MGKHRALALLRIKEWFPDDIYLPLRDFIHNVDKRWQLTCNTGPTLEAVLTGALFTLPEAAIRDIELEVLSDIDQIVVGGAYTLVPANASALRWEVLPDVRLVWTSAP